MTLTQWFRFIRVPAVLRPILVACAFWLLFEPEVGRADGLIIPIPPPQVQGTVPDLAVKHHFVQITIADQVATTCIDQVFHNESPYELEGTYIFPLPEDAAISDFTMLVDGRMLSGKVLDREEARRIYEDIVRSRRDPALLEYAGRDAFRASIYPIEPYGDKRVQLTYRQVLQSNAGLAHYVYPLSTEQFSSRPLEQLSITVELRANAPIRAIYSPSHAIHVERRGERAALISFEANGVLPDTDFELYYSTADDDVGLSVLSYSEPGEDGYFLMLITPRLDVAEQAVVAKDVVFVLDTSGSMEGSKLRQAQEALEFVLNHLNAEDRFNIVAFNTGVTKYATNMQAASARSDATRFVRSLSAGGGTNIHRALLEAVDMQSSRPQFLIFLTDGLPTAGETDLNAIISELKAAAPASLRLFSFGVGYDVNTLLLDSISQDHRGASAYVEPGETIEGEVAALYTKIKTPVLSDVDLLVEGVQVEDMYPYPLPDLFAGSQLLVAGRYREGGSAQVTLEGTVNGHIRRLTYPAVRLSGQGGSDFVPRLWASRKIGYLLKEIRLHGEDQELVEEVVSLSVRFGILTPFTSFLVDEGEDVLTETGRQRIAHSSELAAPTAMPQVGAKAVANSQVQSNLEEAVRIVTDEVPELALVASKAFVLRDGIWTDTTFDPATMHPRTIVFGTDSYFQLLADHPEWAKYFALGEQIIVVLDNLAYQVSPSESAVISLPTSRAVAAPLLDFWNRLRKMIR